MLALVATSFQRAVSRAMISANSFGLVERGSTKIASSSPGGIVCARTDEIDRSSAAPASWTGTMTVTLHGVSTALAYPVTGGRPARSAWGTLGAMPTKIILDVDTGIDDALALLYALGHPDVELVAVTCVAGNVGAAQVAENTASASTVAATSCARTTDAPPATAAVAAPSDPARRSTTSRPVSWFFNHLNFHSVHHAFPRVPFYALEEAHQRFLALYGQIPVLGKIEWIATVLIPGAAAPKLISAETVKAMKPGDVRASGADIILVERPPFSPAWAGVLDRLQREGELRVVDDQFGAPTWSRDVAEATRRMLSTGRATAGMAEPAGIFHVAASGRTSWFHYADAIAGSIAEHGIKVRARLLPTTAADQNVKVANIETMENNKADMISVAPNLREFAAANLYKDYKFSFHPGALKYFKDKSIAAKAFQ